MIKFNRYFLLCLLCFTWLGLAAAQPEPVSVLFHIDHDEVKGGLELVSSAERIKVEGVRYLRERIADGAFSVVVLVDEKEELVAMDAVVGGYKETFHFNAANSAKTNVLIVLNMFGLPDDTRFEAYKRIDHHPKYPELVTLYPEAKRYPNSDMQGELAAEIAMTIVEEMREE